MTELKYCRCLYYSASALTRSVTKIAEEEFALTGLSPSYAFLLMTVNSLPGIGPSTISDHMKLTPSTVTRLIEKMEVKGYLKRKQNGRETGVYPTKQSVNLDHKLRECWRKLDKKYKKLLGTDNSLKLTESIYEAYKSLNNNNL